MNDKWNNNASSYLMYLFHFIPILEKRFKSYQQSNFLIIFEYYYAFNSSLSLGAPFRYIFFDISGAISKFFCGTTIHALHYLRKKWRKRSRNEHALKILKLKILALNGSEEVAIFPIFLY